MFAYISYFILILMGGKKNVSKEIGFDVTKEIISEYNNINVIKNKSYVSIYNIKRRVIKLSDFCYEGKSLSAVCLALIEAGISVIDGMKHKYIDLFRNVITNLKIVYIHTAY